jgi:hypothetical protein
MHAMPAFLSDPLMREAGAVLAFKGRKKLLSTLHLA